MVRLVYFGFTECPDICPIHLAQLSDVLELPQSPENVVVLFITVDPERDTPQVLRSYLDQFDSEFVGLSGSKIDLEAAQLAFGALVAAPQYPIEGKLHIRARWQSFCVWPRRYGIYPISAPDSSN